jgi:hypothetical protein
MYMSGPAPTRWCAITRWRAATRRTNDVRRVPSLHSGQAPDPSWTTPMKDRANQRLDDIHMDVPRVEAGFESRTRSFPTSGWVSPRSCLRRKQAASAIGSAPSRRVEADPKGRMPENASGSDSGARAGCYPMQTPLRRQGLARRKVATSASWTMPVPEFSTGWGEPAAGSDAPAPHECPGVPRENAKRFPKQLRRSCPHPEAGADDRGSFAVARDRPGGERFHRDGRSFTSLRTSLAEAIQYRPRR